MKHIPHVAVTVDDDVPEHMAGIVRAGSVISYGIDNQVIMNHHNLVDNAVYNSEVELVAAIAKKLNVNQSIVAIED